MSDILQWLFLALFFVWLIVLSNHSMELGKLVMTLSKILRGDKPCVKARAALGAAHER